MRSRRLLPILAAAVTLSCAVAADPSSPRLPEPEPATAPGALQRALANLPAGVGLDIGAGTYVLEPSSYTDPTCGNCEDASESVPATLGVRISGRGVTVRGVHRDSVTIVTGAGYGLLFEDCDDCRLSGVTITGGTRDADGRATSAAIVVRRSSVVIEDCAIRDNVGDSATVAGTVVGIAGIVGREQAAFSVRNCEIVRNSWDGIALYRGARAHIADNVIDGVDKASGAHIGGGRGVGIGLTWDARAVVERNRVTRYWKGIGAFVQADADIRENVVEDILTWGIALWGPAGSTPSARIERNIIYRTGACGVMIDRPQDGSAAGTLVDNIIARTGQNERYDSGEPYCWQRPIARHHVPPELTERANLLFDNRQPRSAGSAPAPLPELLQPAFAPRARPLAQRLATHPALRDALVFRELEWLPR